MPSLPIADSICLLTRTLRLYLHKSNTANGRMADWLTNGRESPWGRMSDHYHPILTVWATRRPMPMAGCHKSRGKYIVTEGSWLSHVKQEFRKQSGYKINLICVILIFGSIFLNDLWCFPKLLLKGRSWIPHDNQLLLQIHLWTYRFFKKFQSKLHS